MYLEAFPTQKNMKSEWRVVLTSGVTEDSPWELYTTSYLELFERAILKHLVIPNSF